MFLVSLVGPPNSGKTTLFNLLSGQKVKTVNYPGATIEYYHSKIDKKFGFDVELIDTPGIISLIPASIDEIITIDGIYSHPEYGTPDLIITTVDASQLSRHLVLVNDLIEANFNVVVAITMNDILARKNFEIDFSKLSNELSIPVIKIDTLKENGIDNLVKIIKDYSEKNKNQKEIKRINEDTLALVEKYNKISEIEKKVMISKNSGIINLLNDFKNLHKPDDISLKIDAILLSKTWGLLFFFFAMSVTFASVFWVAAPIMDLIDYGFAYISEWITTSFGINWLTQLLANGLVAGFGSVAVFVPQILILFLILGLLEDSGYLARGAMLVDKPLSKLGLNGRSFAPMVSGFACTVPAIMAARTIPNRRERLLTIFILPLLSCSARIPVYLLLIGFLVPTTGSLTAGIILASIYLLSIVSSLVAAGIINKFKNSIIPNQDHSSFILELPTYKKPKFNNVFFNAFTSTKSYIIGAGPIILIFSIVLWALTFFPAGIDNSISNENGNFEQQLIENSYASNIGKFLEPAVSPLGVDWRVGVAIITSFAAREVFVSSMALMFQVNISDEDSIQKSLLKNMQKAKKSDGTKVFTTSSIIGLIVFFIIAMQCVSTLAITKKETGSWRMPILQFVIYTISAYILAVSSVNLIKFLGIA